MNVKRGLLLLCTGVLAVALAIPVVGLMVIASSEDAEAQPRAPSDTLAPDAVPAEFRDLIIQAAEDCDQGLSPAVLAAQLEVESAGWDPKYIYGPDTSPAGAQGIAQFMPYTWPSWGEDENGDGVADPFDPQDAIPAQGRFMCSLLRQAKEHPEYSGSPTELALAGYNAGWGRLQEYEGVPPQSFADGQTYDYVQRIMELSREMAASNELVPAALPSDYEDALPADTPPEVRAAISWALTEALDGWYSYGGDCTEPLGDDPAHRCDCSSLVQQAYAAGGVELPRTTFDQVNVGRAVDMDSPKPGDLVFSAGSDGTVDSPGHIGLYIGDGQIIEAPRTGVRTRVVTYDSWRNATDYSIRIAQVRRVVDW